jgi:hypothetical protein
MKPLGFRKVRARFVRENEDRIEIIDFQASRSYRPPCRGRIRRGLPQVAPEWGVGNVREWRTLATARGAGDLLTVTSTLQHAQIDKAIPGRKNVVLFYCTLAA